jgi:armadillo repeat-containing protein 8
MSLIHKLRNEANKDLHLRAILNHLIGNETRKSELVQDGILPALVTLLNETPSTRPHEPFLQTANLLNLLAHEGPAFVGPILESNLVPLLLRRLSSSSTAERLAVLKCLNEIALNLPSREPGRWAFDTRLDEAIYDDSVVASLVQWVQKDSYSTISLQICQLICRTCRTVRQKQILVDAGLLGVLAHRLASFVVSAGLVAPSLETLDFPTSTSSLSSTYPSHTDLSPVLETIALLLEHSSERIEQFLNEPSILSVLPQPQSSSTEIPQPPWSSASSLQSPRSRTAFDGLLPVFPLKERTNSPNQLNFPPLGAGSSAPRRRPSFHPSTALHSSLSIIPEHQDEKDERTIVPFLLLLARESRGKRRFLACKLLVILASHKRTSATRLRSFAGLVVPMLVKTLDVDGLSPQESDNPDETYLCDGMPYKKAVPAVLAQLLRDDQELQKAAVEARVIEKLSLGLRATFATPPRRSQLWRPVKSTKTESSQQPRDCFLGPGGPSCQLRQDMAYREGTLHAFASIAAHDDDYRKRICDEGVLAEIILSMQPFGSPEESGSDEAGTGSSTATVLAACGAVRAMTRSVTALRTKLVDAEVAKAVIKLMNGSDLEIRIAATKVLTNLAMDFSPMKESVGESAVVKKLCEQAHSANARLRLESIWALKQLVVNAPKKLKQEVINELGSSWIKLLIRTDPYDIPKGEVIGLIDKDYSPRLRSSYTEPPQDVVMSEDSDGEASMTYADANSEHMPDAEDEFDKHSPEEDLAIQEQVLDLIRNIFVTDRVTDTASDLVDYVLQEMGVEEFFSILKTRISPKTMYGPTRKDNHVSAPPAGVVIRVLYIVLHIAASGQKWRMVIVAENELLKRILGFSSHAEREVRANCCWLAINLMFEDEASDRNSCRRRAGELSKLGYRLQLQRLENDPDLDVRERAKTAMTLFSTLLDQR